jgi:hypothetical protein
VLFLFVLCAPALTQESIGIDVGIGGEGIFYSGKGFSAGGAVQGLYAINEQWALGLRASFFQDINDGKVFTLEPVFLGRWYFVQNPLRIFLQAEAGAALFKADDTFYPAFSGGLGAGMRVPFKNWYAELFARGGYPYLAGFGITLGYTF